MRQNIILKQLGYKVDARGDVLEALNLFRQTPDKYDLVITDQTMPVMTGYKLAQELMRIRPGIPIILCTGFSETVSKEAAEAIGIRKYVMKPIVSAEAARIIRQVLDENAVDQPGKHSGD